MKLMLLLKEKRRERLNQHFLILQCVTYRLLAVRRVQTASSVAFFFLRGTLESHHGKVFPFFRAAVQGAKGSCDGSSL